MERLTIDEIIEHCDRKAEIYEKVCGVKYLETKGMDTGIKEYWEHKQVAEYLKKLKNYEGLEEQGLLLRLPCKVGSNIYRITDDGVDVAVCREIRVADEEMYIESVTLCDWISFDEIGKMVFLTEAEAEAKLKEMEGAK